MTGEVLLWLILFVAMTVIEFASMQLVSVWFALGAFVALVAAAFGAPLYLQIILFTVISAVSLIATRPLIRKFLKKGTVATNAELDIGKEATVIEAINNSALTGRVRLNGVDWTARSSNGEAIDEGTTVVIDKIDGSKLFVSVH